jgi:hypothetical protein
MKTTRESSSIVGRTAIACVAIAVPLTLGFAAAPVAAAKHVTIRECMQAGDAANAAQYNYNHSTTASDRAYWQGVMDRWDRFLEQNC